MANREFSDLFSIPLRNGLTKPKRVRGSGFKMVNMGELFQCARMKNLAMDRVPLSDKEYASSMLETGDLLFARQSLVLEGAGKCSIFMDDDEEVCFESHIIRCRLNKKISDPLYFYYFFSSPLGRATITSIVEQGAGAAGIRGKDLANLPVPDVPLSQQKAIAHILGTLDDKIELNRRMNETLEAMAQALFKSWFVDFDPVIDNALAAGNPIPAELADKAECRKAAGASCVPSDIARLFPASFQSSELGWIPEGWTAGKLEDIADNPRRGVKAGEAAPGTPYIALQHMPKRSIALGEWETADDVASGKFGFAKGEILFGKLRPYFHKVGIAPVDGVCSTDILVVVPKEDERFSVVLGHVTSTEFVDYTTATSSGTRMPRTNWKDMGAYAVAIPDLEVTKLLSEQMQETVQHIHLNIEQSRTLATLRDTLLPKLLSGELRIEDAEAMMEVAE